MDKLQPLIDEFKAIVQTKAFWFLLGLSMSGENIPSIVATVRAFIGV
ncbi:MAG TPA: hypothetical protein VF443_04755 [Nitrospira sp.]